MGHLNEVVRDLIGILNLHYMVSADVL